jgi:hypothetical protein
MKRLLTPPAQVLSADELSLIMAYRAMDQRHKAQNLRTMTEDSKLHAQRTAPTLRLVSAAVTAVRP